MAKKNNRLLEKIWKVIQENTAKLNKIDMHVAVMNSELGEVRDEIKEIKKAYVTIERFSPVEKAVYAIIGAFGLAVLGAIATLVIR